MKLDAAKQAALDLHNQARREAPGAPRPDLTWDDSLASEAETWALEMALTGSFSHAPQTAHGENLAYFEPAGERNYVAATSAWIAEKKNPPRPTYHRRMDRR